MAIINIINIINCLNGFHAAVIAAVDAMNKIKNSNKVVHLCHFTRANFSGAIKPGKVVNCGSGVYMKVVDITRTIKETDKSYRKIGTMSADDFGVDMIQKMINSYGNNIKIVSVMEKDIIDVGSLIVNGDPNTKHEIARKYAGKFVRHTHSQWGDMVVYYGDLVPEFSGTYFSFGFEEEYIKKTSDHYVI